MRFKDIILTILLTTLGYIIGNCISSYWYGLYRSDKTPTTELRQSILKNRTRKYPTYNKINHRNAMYDKVMFAQNHSSYNMLNI